VTQPVAAHASAPHHGEVRRAWLVAAAAIVVTVVVVAVAAGWDVTAWLGSVWDSLKSISPIYLVAALALQTLQTAFAAAAWHGILRYAYPETEVRYRGVLACYATGVALNSVTPAHAGTLVTVLMFVAIIPTATVAGVVAAAAVEKLFFAVVGIVVFLYLFLSVGGSFERKFGLLSHHPWATVLAAAAAAIVFGLGGRLAWRRLKGLWEQAKQGGKILSDRRAYVTQVLVPQVLA
jgi:Lysylphosphatidylglycerol synthase TM region